MTSRYIVFLMVLNYFREICPPSYKAEFLCRPYSVTGITVNIKGISEGSWGRDAARQPLFWMELKR